VSDVRRQTVTLDVRDPFELRRVRVSGPDVAGLKLLELLLRTKLVGLFLALVCSCTYSKPSFIIAEALTMIYDA